MNARPLLTLRRWPRRWARTRRWLRAEIARRDPTRHLCWALLGLGTLAAAWLTLRSSGNFPRAAWLPDALATWVDEHGRLRNVPAYLLLSLPALMLAPPEKRVRAALGMAVLAGGLELAQLAVGSRRFDWWDIALSWLGVSFGYAYCVWAKRGWEALRLKPISP